MTEKRISDCKGTSIEIIQSEEEREIWEKMNKTSRIVGHYHRSHIQKTEVSEGEDKKNGAEKIFEEIMTENCPNLVKDINL